MNAASDGRLVCRVEIPKGSRNKYEWDSALGRIKLDRFLFSSIVFPTDYGFLPDTLAEDGDTLDALVCVSAPTFPGCAIVVEVLGLLRTTDEDGVDDKVLCVPVEDPAWNHMRTLDDLPAQLRGEIEHFFGFYKELEGKHVTVEGWAPRERALAVIEEARSRWRESA